MSSDKAEFDDRMMNPLPTINKKRIGKPKTAHVEFKPPKNLENQKGQKLLSSICLGGEQKGKRAKERLH